MPVWLPRIHFRGSHRDGPGPFWASRRTCRARFRRSWLTRVKGARRIRHKGQIMMGRPKYVPRRWRCALSSRQARLSAIRPRAVVATDHWLLAPELAAGIRRREAPTMLLGCALRRFDSAALTDGRCSGGFTPEATGVARRADAPKLSALPRAPCGFSARRGWRWDSHRPSAGEPFEPDAIDWSGMRALSEWATIHPERVGEIRPSESDGWYGFHAKRGRAEAWSLGFRRLRLWRRRARSSGREHRWAARHAGRCRSILSKCRTNCGATCLGR